ncbi:MAG TPA: PfkB family carbohydrate kinase, partial [Candidatus Dormibacteraeota bacterium]
AGGSSLLAAIGAWLVGREAAICALIGPEVSTDLIRQLTRAGIDLSRSRSQSAQTQAAPMPEQLASVSPAWAVHLCGLSPARQRELQGAVAQRVMAVTVDTERKAELAGADRREIIQIAAGADAFLIGRTEVEYLWPGEPPREVLRILGRQGVSTAIIKLGVGGSIGIRDGRIAWMSAFPLTRPAAMPGGDVYAGAFSAMFAPDRNIARAMAWATAAASTVMESPSPLDLLTDFGRRMVESRARVLETDFRNAP